jgi:hypothetical protein
MDDDKTGVGTDGQQGRAPGQESND